LISLTESDAPGLLHGFPPFAPFPPALSLPSRAEAWSHRSPAAAQAHVGKLPAGCIVPVEAGDEKDIIT